MDVKRVGTGIIIIITLFVWGGCSKSPTGPAGGGWTFELVDAGSQMGWHSSLTTTSDGTVHILYHDGYELTLNHARRIAPDVWERTRLDTIGWKGEDVAVSCGLGDTLHIAYRDMFVKDLRYARYDGTDWVYDRLDPFRATGEEVIIDSRSDGVHMLELKDDSNQLNYWHGGLENWNLVSYIHINGPRPTLALAQGPAGPVLSLFATQTSYSRSVQKYDLLLYTADDPAGPWVKTTLISDLLRTDYSYQSLAMDFDEMGQLHLLYRLTDGDLHDMAGSRVAREVEAGRVRINRGPGGDLWALYPISDGFGLSNFRGGVWRRMTSINALNHLGKWAMHIDGEGTVHISVYSHSGHRFWYGRWEPGA
ncbi:hypothetical protein ACFL6T_05450 [Candidatus Zixiibacteriota bacterium]